MKGRKRFNGSPPERFKMRVLRSDGCWEWDGHRRRGYGKFGVSASVSVLAHRYAYELWVGPIPEGHHVHHICGNPACVRPDHLDTRTPSAHSLEHVHATGVVENQFGVWPIARTAEERRLRDRDWMRAKRARMRQEATSC